ncbi:1-acylglycerol-3-phosphate O [Choiromyces venosus 120613-1]|uniref:1-acyl-sn-glycerol-3-phosphate acyltransferase n=1 Tax=Choiromyces venosus 120613-1 TaxID=1336337 RepID=A0A3N4JUS1_9PEZI|nr:1-acylglycerol-3-phosphate O [Choiromyces venosus 120613-1]
MVNILLAILLFPICTIMTLTILGRFFKSGRFYARILSCYFLLVTCAAYGVLASVALRVVGKVSIAQWTTARAFKNLTCPIIGLEFKVENEGALDTRPAVFVSNHQSELDIIFLGRVFPKHCSVTAKRSLKYIPFLGWFMALSGTVFIDRTNRKSALAAFDSAVHEIKGNKQSVWIFPEGTRSYFSKPELLPFKKGAFHLAIQAGVPIVPVVVANYSHVLHLQERTFEPGVINVKVLDPIDTKGLTVDDVDALVLSTRENMLKELKLISTAGVKAEKSQ